MSISKIIYNNIYLFISTVLHILFLILIIGINFDAKDHIKNYEEEIMKMEVIEMEKKKPEIIPTINGQSKFPEILNNTQNYSGIDYSSIKNKPENEELDSIIEETTHNKKIKNKKEEKAPKNSIKSPLKSIDKKKSNKSIFDDIPKNDNNKKARIDMSNLEIDKLSSQYHSALAAQIEKNWFVHSFAGSDIKMRCELLIKVAKNGRILYTKDYYIDQKLLNNKYYKAFIDSAKKAIMKSSPLHDLPPEKDYEYWQEIIITFDSSKMN